jgi:pimeloyl-ACP methyl ester carboxylesterase
VPTVVLHGLSDPLVSVSGGRALARAIPGARFVGFPGMGHDLPGALWPMFAEEICSIARKADSRREPGTDRP